MTLPLPRWMNLPTLSLQTLPQHSALYTLITPFLPHTTSPMLPPDSHPHYPHHFLISIGGTTTSNLSTPLPSAIPTHPLLLKLSHPVSTSNGSALWTAPSKALVALPVIATLARASSATILPTLRLGFQLKISHRKPQTLRLWLRQKPLSCNLNF